MSHLLWLVPIALAMGLVGLGAFLWSLRDGQYDDLDGAAERVLLAEAQDRPLPEAGATSAQPRTELVDSGHKKRRRS